MKKFISFFIVLLPFFAYAEKIIIGPANCAEGLSTEKVIENVMFHFEEDSYDHIAGKNGAFLGFFWSVDGGDVKNAKVLNSRIVTKGIDRFVKKEDSTTGGFPECNYVMITESSYIFITIVGGVGVRINEYGRDPSGEIDDYDNKLFIFIDCDVDQQIELRDMLNKAAKIIN